MQLHDFSRYQEPNEEEVAEAEKDSGTGAGEDYKPTSIPCCLSALTFVGHHGHPFDEYCRLRGPGASVAPMSDCAFCIVGSCGNKKGPWLWMSNFDAGASSQISPVCHGLGYSRS